MGNSLAYKILEDHLVEGVLNPGNAIAIKIDQTLTQDATGTMAYLQFEALGIPKVKTELSVSYIDHNTLQSGFENADDHRFLQTVASKHGIYFSRPGNGICHQVHLERFGIPGKTLLGSDSHTPTGGGIGMIAIGAGGLDVAVAMGGGAFHLTAPKVTLVRLSGALSPWVSAKDVILEVLRIMSVKGGLGKIIEYGGKGVAKLSVPQRATITNMGAELGATTSIFPSDEMTRLFLKAQNREHVWNPLIADDDAEYDDTIDIDLSALEPLIAQPHSPDNVCKVSELSGTKVNQVCIGSCTNSSYTDLMMVASALKDKNIHPDVSLTISPGSRQVLEMIARNGALADIVSAGARILENTCGPCIGMGQAPPTEGISIRSFNRNFPGRSGTKSAQVFLASPEVCVAAALTGEISDPRKLDERISVTFPDQFHIDDSMILPPSDNPATVTVVRGPNIKPLPINNPLPDTLEGKLLLKVDDNITTDHIMPAGAKILPLRSNVPKLSEHVFSVIDESFAKRAKDSGGGFIVGGVNYGQGSSREHAALAPMYLGVKWVLTKSFARIHKANLINFGILPLNFVNDDDYEKLSQGDQLKIENVIQCLKEKKPLTVKNLTNNSEVAAEYELTDRQIDILLAGGLLNYTRESA